ncbi:bifunctional metallophosphatase/5'-nucleotidase [Agromyces intestinalis]|uniref:Bifunctional metallophosphatase/5'-nucleotidase n=1 Tax=Agromyces intestinalis TaxID=2592652 RepID=A0A5C1YHX0_9MICO|nr:5'-nucleotidase C-terminal domain-containing protein [Agromyces intestinalis]QEO15020.1 bifunctional metallophosphatase/5'-nucleotidase [Agromyces intestinalis]
MHRRTIRGLSTAALATAGFVAIGLLGPAPAFAEDDVTINLVTVNDFHGRIKRDGASTGAAALATAVNGIRAQNPNTIFAAAGDLIGASTFESFILDELPTIDALNAAGLDVSAAGNHEFDRGWETLRTDVQDRANWEYIAANVFYEGTDDTALAESWTTTVGGVQVGFVGAVTEELPSLVSPAGIAELEVRDIVDSVNAAADRLEQGGADIVVLLIHEGAATTAEASATDPDSPFGQVVLGVDDSVDAIVSGHTHLAYNHVINGRPVISSGQYGEKFSNMEIVYDTDTDSIVSMDNEVIDASTPIPGTSNFTYRDVPDQAVTDLLAPYLAEADVRGAVPLGSVTADLARGLQPDVDANGEVDPSKPAVENRGAESTLGNFVADVQYWSANQDAAVDIAFMNPGGLRTNIAYAPDGVVTYREAANVQPFANSLFTQTLTGAQVKQVLEEQWQPAGSSRPFLKLGVNQGLTYTFDPTLPEGQRITGIALHGVPIDPAATYRVVANSFLAAGGDNFFTLGQGTDRRDSGKIDLQSMVDWFTEFQTGSPDPVQRSVGVHLSAPDADGYDAGDSLTVDLSSLDFSANPTGGEVVVSIGGKELGRSAIDTSLVRLNDEFGRASITAPIPAGVYGVQQLTVSVPGTGSTATLPITINAKPVAVTVVGLPSPIITTSSKAVSYVGVVIAHDLSRPVGTVTVYEGSKAVGSVQVTASSRGAFTVPVGKLSRGVHVLKAVFDGGPGYGDDTSFSAPVVVLK